MGSGSGFDFIVDFTDYKDRQGSYVDEGKYNVIVEDAELSKTKKNNDNMVTVFLRIVGTQFDGLTIVERLVDTKAAHFRLVGFLQATGYKVEHKKQKLQAKNFIGKRLTVTVKDGDPFNGRVKSEVDTFERFTGKALDGGTKKGASEDELFDEDVEDTVGDESAEWDPDEDEADNGFGGTDEDDSDDGDDGDDEYGDDDDVDLNDVDL